MSDEIDQIEENEGGDGSKKKILLIVGVILLLVCGGVGAYFVLNAGEEVPEEGEVTEQTSSSESSEEVVSQKKEEKVDLSIPVALGEEPIYVQVGPVVSNISAPDKYQYVQATLTLMTYSKSMEEVVMKFDVKIRHMLQKAIRDVPEESLITNEGIESLTSTVKKRLNKFLSEKGLDVKYIDEVFLSDVVIE